MFTQTNIVVSGSPWHTFSTGSGRNKNAPGSGLGSKLNKARDHECLGPRQTAAFNSGEPPAKQTNKQTTVAL